MSSMLMQLLKATGFVSEKAAQKLEELDADMEYEEEESCVGVVVGHGIARTIVSDLSTFGICATMQMYYPDPTSATITVEQNDEHNIHSDKDLRNFIWEHSVQSWCALLSEYGV